MNKVPAACCIPKAINDDQESNFPGRESQMSLLPCLSPSSPAREAFGRLMPAADFPALARGLDSWQALSSLTGADPRNAIRLIAGWLSTREAIWWGALCLAQLSKIGLLDSKDKARLEKVVAWVQDPTNQTRDAVGTPQDEVSPTPVSLLAAATALTSANISPDSKHPVAGPIGLPHRLVAHAVLLASTLWPDGDNSACLLHFIRLGVEVSEVKILWKPDALPAHPGLRQPQVVIQATTKLKNIWED